MASLFGLDLATETAGGDPNFRLDVGSVVSRTFTVWAANLLPFSVVGLVVMSPVVAGFAAIAISGAEVPLAETALSALSSILTLVMTGGVSYGVFQHLRGTRAGAGEVLRLGVSRLLTVWGTAILSGLAMMLGFCALIVPGLVLMTRYWMAVPVAVIETPGAGAALTRSSELSEGNRWRIFGLALIVVAVQVGATLLMAMVIGLGAGLGGLDVQKQTAGQTLALEVILIPVSALAAVAPVIAYHDLRRGKEGAHVEELLKAFD